MPEATLTCACSPEPDEVFLFYPIIQRKVNAGEFELEITALHSDALFESAARGEVDLVSLPLHAFAQVSDGSELLPGEARLCVGRGPMLVATDVPIPFNENGDHGALREWLVGKRVALTSQLSTGSLVLGLFIGEIETCIIPPDRIQDALDSRLADAVLIESPDWFADGGHDFPIVLDLAAWWAETAGGLPLPIGCCAVVSDLAPTVRTVVERLVEASAANAFWNWKEAAEWAAFVTGSNPRLVDGLLADRVGEFSITLDAPAAESICRLLSLARDRGLILLDAAAGLNRLKDHLKAVA